MEFKLGKVLVGVTVFVIVAGLITYDLVHKSGKVVQLPEQTSEFGQTISDGTITVGYSRDVYGLAVNQAQILVQSYIPPCDEGFDYCIYRIGTEYTNTNFESAGLRVKKHTDLESERLCLDTPPEGYTALKKPDQTASKDTYASSVFKSIGDAGAGHYAKGSIYRLYVRENKSCYDITTRIGETQFANFPAGIKDEFSATDRSHVEEELEDILNNISLKSGHKNLFPNAS